MSNLNIEYKASVKTPAGWRSVYMIATAKKLSEKRFEVIEVVSIDDEPVQYNMSRTGANRQKFNGAYFAEQEVGKKKNISSLLRVTEL